MITIVSRVSVVMVCHCTKMATLDTPHAVHFHNCDSFFLHLKVPLNLPHVFLCSAKLLLSCNHLFVLSVFLYFVLFVHLFFLDLRNFLELILWFPPLYFLCSLSLECLFFRYWIFWSGLLFYFIFFFSLLMNFWQNFCSAFWDLLRVVFFKLPFVLTCFSFLYYFLP